MELLTMVDLVMVAWLLDMLLFLMLLVVVVVLVCRVITGLLDPTKLMLPIS